VDKPYFLSANVLSEIELPTKGIISHPLVNDEYTKIILFGFAPGHVLAAHTAPVPATIQILSGEGTLTLGADTFQVSPGCLVHMRPQLVHSVLARTPLQMLLTLNKAARQDLRTE
jgi:quercetin dioxygenase-like cupin family protein